LSLLVPARSHAQPLTQRKAMAEVLFHDGTELAAKGRHAEACQRFESSRELDPALGTILYLADCYDRIGRTASAWVWFVEARELARNTSQAEREMIASRRAADLERRLTRLRLVVPDAARLPGLAIEINGVAVPSSSFGVPVPVDPGRTLVRAVAPGYSGWSQTVVVSQGSKEHAVDVPALSRTPEASAGSPRGSLRAADGATPPRWVGYALGGGGLLGLGTAAVFGLRADDLDEQSQSECRSDDRDACTASGKSLRDRAFGAATASTVAAVAGAALLGAGITWLLFVPEASEPTRPAARISLGAGATLGGAELRIEGSL
jgi:hypothetical protein